MKSDKGEGKKEVSLVRRERGGDSLEERQNWHHPSFLHS